MKLGFEYSESEEEEVMMPKKNSRSNLRKCLSNNIRGFLNWWSINEVRDNTIRLKFRIYYNIKINYPSGIEILNLSLWSIDRSYAV